MKVHISINELRHMNSKFKAYSKKISINEFIGTSTLDKLEILADYYSEDYLKKYWKRGGSTQNSSYSSVKKYTSRKNNKSIIISSGGDRRIFDKLFRFKITLNPSHFENFQLLFSFLEKLLCTKTKGTRHKIHRIDFSVLLPNEYFPVSSVHEYIYFPQKQSMHIYKSDDIDGYRGDFSGFRLGRNPETLICYDIEMKLKKLTKKGFERKVIHNIHVALDRKSQLTAFKEKVINIELQLHGKKLFCLGITELKDLKKIINHNPFENIAFHDFYKIRFEGRKNCSELIKLILLMKTRGYHTGRQFYNRKNNYHRMVGYVPLLRLGKEQLTLSEILNRSFKSGMKAFLGHSSTTSTQDT